ncbi:hypothetical protein AVEN_220306-1, partial [Araneus ventricosus]
VLRCLATVGDGWENAWRNPSTVEGCFLQTRLRSMSTSTEGSDMSDLFAFYRFEEAVASQCDGLH